MENIIVTLKDSHVPQIYAVVFNMRSIGMQVDRVMPTVGVISGRVTPEVREKVEQLEAVSAVETEQQIEAISNGGPNSR